LKRPRFKLAGRGNPFNSLFGRMVLLMAFLLIADHTVWMVTFGRQPVYDHPHALRNETLLTVSALSQARSAHGDTAFSPTLKAALQNIRQVAIETPEVPPQTTLSHAPPAIRQFVHGLRQDLPPGTEVRMRPPPLSEVWVHLAGAASWIVVPIPSPPSGGPLVDVIVALILAILCAIFGAWQMQKPLRELARAATNFHPQRHVEPVRERGPSEVRRVIKHFNQTVGELSKHETDRAVMLAGVAHDLRAPITRIRARADIVGDPSVAVGFIRDATSLSQIVDQFLDFSRVEFNESPLHQVDEFCRTRWSAPDESLAGTGEICLKLGAGPGFVLPVTVLERILSNLVDNALTYGKSPVEIATRRAKSGGWELAVSDRGPGIPPEQLEAVTRPFVRLDPSRSGSAHCGLGLSIVEKLTLRHRGTLTLANAPRGGLHVTVNFPDAGTAAVLTETPVSSDPFPRCPLPDGDF
jgi:two-component system, OmpR family, osmolarity sensor histidine kinase EnvZ